VRAGAWRGAAQEQAVAQTLAEHHSILDALEFHDAATAHAWATVHIASATRSLGGAH
jgi:GntR family transcriptional repressor for pyruvate dehydrogenase complex